MRWIAQAQAPMLSKSRSFLRGGGGGGHHWRLSLPLLLRSLHTTCTNTTAATAAAAAAAHPTLLLLRAPLAPQWPPPFGSIQRRTKKTVAGKRTAVAKSNKPPNYKVNKSDLLVKQQKAKAKAKRTTYSTEDLTNQVTFSLCDAIRIIRAAEVGYGPTSPKYEMHIKLRTSQDGPVIRNRLALPHPVRTDLRVAVICPANLASRARAAGAVLAGTDEVFEAVKAGRFDFDRCIAQDSMLKEIGKSGIARILGPRRLMPSVKEKTVVKDVVSALKEVVSSAEYRERQGVIRLSVGQLGFTPQQVQQNLQVIMKTVKKDIADLSDKVSKDIHEVVLSSTHGPGLSLSGEFVSRDGIEAKELVERQ